MLLFPGGHRGVDILGAYVVERVEEITAQKVYVRSVMGKGVSEGCRPLVPVGDVGLVSNAAATYLQVGVLLTRSTKLVVLVAGLETTIIEIR